MELRIMILSYYCNVFSKKKIKGIKTSMTLSKLPFLVISRDSSESINLRLEFQTQITKIILTLADNNKLKLSIIEGVVTN